ncbi:uncharacterized protein BT62DRAFT_1010913 [Guyanagaster necrorhizus]|uniref:Uncharacterized protein n=1 Tax=Guyanagaster necrorhizus TaxID=856835 RepID=A0A9P7VJ87_9AGAR|nr:uncharacterized protein BT62DRAFT_1010913 [Guyanagaster necrorhizus MCA 3950]KAG7442138.1 hypothetical protein BT62DRAFT_1010913 [Guyanagaster necrorhizus MCA 3950]
MDLITSPCCSFLRSIHTLIIQELEQLNDDNGFNMIILACNLANLSLLETPSTTTSSIFPNLKKLCIDSTIFPLISEENWANFLLFLSSLTGMTHLAFESCYFPTLDHVIRILSSCRLLESVSLDYNQCEESLPPEEMTPSYLGGLPASLSSLLFTVGYEDSLILQIIPIAGPSLKHLSISLNLPSITDNEAASFSRNTNLEYSTNLETIIFPFVPISNDFGIVVSCTRHIPDILRKVTSSSINEITLAVCILSATDFNNLDWESIIETLSRENYRNLERFSVLQVMKDIEDESKKCIAKELKPVMNKNPSLEIVVSRRPSQFMEARFGW